MESNLFISDAQLEAYKTEYMTRLQLANEIFDGRPFFLSSHDDRPSESMYDAVMAAVDRNWDQRERMLTSKQRIKNAYWNALGTPEAVQRFSGRANTSSDVKTRMAAMTQLFIEAMENA
ncbi:hypothetical protein WJ63_19400 [Burkholderia pyrrocinia]|nr:hypothetical protein WJ63_19400 [Burkholderia pyrrocinia]